MSYSLFPIIIASIGLLKAFLEAFSIVRTDFFVKLFFMDFSMDTTTFDIKRFRILDIILCTTCATACLLYAFTGHFWWIIAVLPVWILLLYFMAKMNKKDSHVFTIGAVIMFSSMILSCQINNESENVTADLFSILNSEKKIALEYCRYYGISTEMGTKSEGSPDDIIVLPEWAYDYVLKYVKADSFEFWDESMICSSLGKDSSLSYDQKVAVATLIGDISALKESATAFLEHETKSREEDCRALYYRKVKECILERLTMGVIGGSFVGKSLIGAELGIIGGLISSWCGIQELGREYIRCSS